MTANNLSIQLKGVDKALQFPEPVFTEAGTWKSWASLQTQLALTNIEPQRDFNYGLKIQSTDLLTFSYWEAHCDVT